MLLKKFPISDDKSIKKTLDDAFDQVKDDDTDNNFWGDLLKRK